MGLTKSLALRERWRRSRRRGLNCAQRTLSPAIAGALPKGEPLAACNFRGMGFARSRRLLQRRNTKAKLAIKKKGGIMMKDKKQTCKDVYDRYHKFPGDTSEGRVLTVLFSIIGAIISTIGFYLYLKYKHIVPLMISFCLFSILYTYVELCHLFIRKYWFRYHRRLAIVLSIIIYWIIIFLLVLAIAYYFSLFTISWYCIYIPFILMPPILIICFLLFGLLYIAGS